MVEIRAACSARRVRGHAARRAAGRREDGGAHRAWRGVFGNKPEWIAEAIEQAVLTFKHAGLEIVFNQFDEKEKTALAIVQKLKGSGLLQRASFGAWPRPIQMYTE